MIFEVIVGIKPGGVDQDLLRLDYKEIERPIFHWIPTLIIRT